MSKNLKSLKVPNETTEQMDIDILCESGMKMLPSTVQMLTGRRRRRFSAILFGVPSVKQVSQNKHLESQQRKNLKIVRKPCES